MGVASNQALCETYCEEYGNYVYCISGAMSWTQCAAGTVDSPPTYGYPYFSPPAFIEEADADAGIHKDKTSLIAGAVAGGIAGTAICSLIVFFLYSYCLRSHPRPRREASAGDKSLKKDGLNSKEPTANSKPLSTTNYNILRLDVLASKDALVNGHGKASFAPGAVGNRPHTKARNSCVVTFPLNEIISRKHARFVSLDEVRTATATINYSRTHVIGEGRFGSVYYGRLASGEKVAVKVNSYKCHQSIQDFENEVSILSSLCHSNVASLVGYCDEHQNRMLIYEFMPKKTVRHHLCGPGSKEPLHWKTRLQIALDAARGLEYLHHHCQPALILHGDITSSNILLTDQFVAKVADLDISRLLPQATTTSPELDNHEYFSAHDPSNRLPYRDPGCDSGSPRTTEDDVYALGVVLLEILSGKPPRHSVLYTSIVTWARDIMKAGSVEKLADRTLEGTYELEVLWKVAELAMACVDPLASHRPNMKQVVQGLTDALVLQNAVENKVIPPPLAEVSDHLSPPASEPHARPTEESEL